VSRGAPVPPHEQHTLGISVVVLLRLEKCDNQIIKLTWGPVRMPTNRKVSLLPQLRSCLIVRYTII